MPFSVCRFVENLRYGVIAAAVFVFGAITTAAFVYFTSKIRKRTQFNADEHLKAFMYQVMDSSEDDVSTSSVPINDQQELAFVITGFSSAFQASPENPYALVDEEASTEQSRVSESAFKELRDIHDMVDLPLTKPSASERVLLCCLDHS